ncbi:hypothetical protein CVT24_001995 [Panaeolus cyanescens]|uniref:Cytochrome c oxidase assembly protein COX15 n=1 Tax=Panaeolus cyanescens TaxID=181874 RepID=A0A409YHG1_9AGAR|nr:hypothetical protein CVT24_001995 [Panaeolus cyanescens]
MALLSSLRAFSRPQVSRTLSSAFQCQQSRACSSLRLPLRLPARSILSPINRDVFRTTSTRLLHSTNPKSKPTDEVKASIEDTTPTEPLPILASPAVGRWLLLSSTLVLGIIVVGGVTRLTESGLSITEWKPITGVRPPITHEEWLVEFEKYKATPEFKLLNHSMTLDDFKYIFFWEWGHRILGRLIGVVFVGPLAYFTFRKKISKPLSRRLTGLAFLIGAQGALGWYMVKSGLEDSIMDTPGAVPRVSQYRLASHLGLAFLLYLGMFGSAMAVIKDWKYANTGVWNGYAGKLSEALKNPVLKSFRRQAIGLTCLVFLTALSGAFVAGLDAGLLYNEFPLMGGRIAPPMDELFSTAYSKVEDKSDIWWRNIFENPTTVQFDHRVLATSTYLTTALLYARTFSPAVKAALPPLARLATTAAFAVANIQVALGISTLLYLVPVPLAAAHQAGSVVLLSAMVHLLITLRRPSTAARTWRAFFKSRSQAVGSTSPKP